jgi:hypothetical protein
MSIRGFGSETLFRGSQMVTLYPSPTDTGRFFRIDLLITFAKIKNGKIFA